MVILNDDDILSKTMYYAYRKDSLQFFFNILSRLDYDFGTLKANSASKNFFILKYCLFAVKDLDLFLKNFKNICKQNNVELNISKGPQKWRGYVNSISSFISCLDIDYLNSLYDQICYHKDCGNLDADFSSGYLDHNFRLSRKNYSYRNVHINLDNIKY